MKKALTWLIVLVILVALMLIASALTGPNGTKLQGVAWILWTAIAAVLIYALYFATAANPAWEVGTRQVVYMAIGAALYGIFAFLFNGTVFAGFDPACRRHPGVLWLCLWPGGGILYRRSGQYLG
jgi:hypothetical protein